jgi:hypothetical protein
MYTKLKLNSQLPYLDKSNEFGYIAGFDLALDPYGNGSFYLLGNFKAENPKLEGNLKLKVPTIGNFNGLVISGSYFDSTPFVENKFLDSDTKALIGIAYPLVGEGFLAGIIYNWEGSDWSKSVFVGSNIAF